MPRASAASFWLLVAPGGAARHRQTRMGATPSHCTQHDTSPGAEPGEHSMHVETNCMQTPRKRWHEGGLRAPGLHGVHCNHGGAAGMAAALTCCAVRQEWCNTRLCGPYLSAAEVSASCRHRKPCPFWSCFASMLHCKQGTATPTWSDKCSWIESHRLTGQSGLLHTSQCVPQPTMATEA